MFGNFFPIPTTPTYDAITMPMNPFEFSAHQNMIPQYLLGGTTNSIMAQMNALGQN